MEKWKLLELEIFPENSIQKLIQKFLFGLIHFNKIFIQLENQDIGHHYVDICAMLLFAPRQKNLC